MKKIFIGTVFVFFLITLACHQKTSNEKTSSCEGFAPSAFKCDLKDGYRMEIVGGAHDMVKFYYQTTEIGFDPIKNGECLNFINEPPPSRINDKLHLMNVLFGTTRERGNFYCYAVVDKEVYRSPVWSEILPGNNVPMQITWEGLTGTVLHIATKAATFTFNPITNKWNCTTTSFGELRGETVLLKPEAK